MKLSVFLKEKLYIIILGVLTNLTIVLFLRALRINGQALVVIELLNWGPLLSILFIEYIRRASYYHRLETTLDNLDQKYHVTEIMEHPLFMDGQILYDTLKVVDKSMADNVNKYKHIQNEYREYIEMWVHEIKTPLAAAKLIISNNPQMNNESLCEEMDKVESFVEQALFYARSTTLEKDYIIKELSLQSMVSKSIKKHARTFIYQKIRVELTDLEETIYSDSKWLEFILDQIIGNALKYMDKEDKVLRIYTTKDSNAVHLHIKDNGIGIDTMDIRRIFDRGFTGKNGRRNEKATGMGLYLCKNLCDKLYLGIHASSFYGQGTSITIDFPISKLMLLK